MFMRYLTVLIPILLSHIPDLHAANWPCWRGPDGLGVSAEKDLPTLWSPEKNVAWKLGIPGKGASSPSVFGDRVYLTTQTKDTALHVGLWEEHRRAVVDRHRASELFERLRARRADGRTAGEPAAGQEPAPPDGETGRREEAP